MAAFGKHWQIYNNRFTDLDWITDTARDSSKFADISENSTNILQMSADIDSEQNCQTSHKQVHQKLICSLFWGDEPDVTAILVCGSE